MAAPSAQVCAEREDLHGPPGDIGVDLHHERVLLRNAAAIDDLLDFNPIFFEAD